MALRLSGLDENPQYPTHDNNDEDNMSDTTILQNNTHVIKPKKSVALSGVPAGNTALCTVGKAVTISTIAATIFSISPSSANLKKWRIC